MASDTEHANNTQNGIVKEDILPANSRPKAITPIDFCVSLELCDRASVSIVMTWSRLNKVFTFGWALLNEERRTFMTRKPIPNPRIGAIIRGRITKTKPFKFIDSRPLVINVAPTRPPINECVEEDGIPRHQEKRFQLTAAAMAMTIVLRVITEVFTKPVVIERATAAPKMKGAIRSAAATKYKAHSGRIAREAITPARMLDESRYPLKNALIKTRTIRKSNIHLLHKFHLHSRERCLVRQSSGKKILLPISYKDREPG